MVWRGLVGVAREGGRRRREAPHDGELAPIIITTVITTISTTNKQYMSLSLYIYIYVYVHTYNMWILCVYIYIYTFT